MKLNFDPGPWGDPDVENVAHKILAAGLGLGESAIEPRLLTWVPEVATSLRRRIVDNPDEGSGGFIEKLRGQLSGAARTEYLLAAELLLLHDLPLSNVGGQAKRQHMSVLSWLDPPAALPHEFALALDRGVFNGGVGFNVGIWNQIGWLLSFIEFWWSRDAATRTRALAFAWEFRELVDKMPTDQPGIRNALLYLAFPATFMPIVSDDHRRAIRDAFANRVGGPSGTDLISIDRDLAAIWKILEAGVGHPFNFYREPYLSQWWKAASTGPRAWLVRPHGDSTTALERWVESDVIELAADRLPDVAAGASADVVRQAVELGYGGEEYPRRLTLATDFMRMLTVIGVGDVVVTRKGEQLYVGRVIGECERIEGPPAFLRRSVGWSRQEPAPTSVLSQAVRDAIDTDDHAIVELTKALNVLKAYLPSTDDPSPAPPRPDVAAADAHVPGATEALADELLLSLDWLEDVVQLLANRRQIVLYGPPGTGKTFAAMRIARHVAGPQGVRLIQFHPSYAYEDFFEGFRPSQEGSSIAFRLTPGPLREIASMAAADPGHPWVLIIDEINRANLAKVFGELYFLLEYRDRAVRLQYSSGEAFMLPPNLYVIGTMNTADRSIALVDAAMRRRFAFVEMHPVEPPVAKLLERWVEAGGHPADERVALLNALNEEIGSADRDFQIGPSYLMTSDAERPGGLERIWKYSILPLLDEFYNGRLDRRQVRDRFSLAALRDRLGSAQDESPPPDPPIDGGPE